MIITICASITFSEEIIAVKKQLEKMHHQVNIPYLTQKINQGELTVQDYLDIRAKDGGDLALRQKQSVDLIKRYWELIKNSDAILVLNLKKKNIENYIGGSMLIEMGFAYGFGKKIFLFNPPPLRSSKIHYVDEIMDMKPIILDRNLVKIT